MHVFLLLLCFSSCVLCFCFFVFFIWEYHLHVWRDTLPVLLLCFFFLCFYFFVFFLWENHLHVCRDTLPVTENLVQVFRAEDVSQSGLRQKPKNLGCSKFFQGDIIIIIIIISITVIACPTLLNDEHFLHLPH